MPTRNWMATLNGFVIKLGDRLADYQ